MSEDQAVSEPIITPEQDRLLLAYEVRRRLQERSDRIAELEHEVEALRAKVARVETFAAEWRKSGEPDAEACADDVDFALFK